MNISPPSSSSDSNDYADKRRFYYDDSDSMLLDEDRRIPTQTWWNRRKYLPWICHGASIVTCLGILLYSYSLTHWSQGMCYDKFNAYSPIAEAMKKVPFIETDYKYSLWYKSPYKGPPTPAVKEAWHDLMRYGTISVQDSDVLRSGVEPNASSVLFPESAGGGYLAVAGGTHHIHCLYYIWRDHHVKDFPEMQANKDGVPEMYERHYEHCIDYLRQGIMCNFDTGIIPYNWVRDNDQPTPNGNTHHKCINWNALQGWMKSRAVEIPEGFEWKQPPGVIPLTDNP